MRAVSTTGTAVPSLRGTRRARVGCQSRIKSPAFVHLSDSGSGSGRLNQSSSTSSEPSPLVPAAGPVSSRFWRWRQFEVGGDGPVVVEPSVPTTAIIPASSWARMWQWNTQRPGKSRNAMRMTTSPPIGTTTVSCSERAV